MHQGDGGCALSGYYAGVGEGEKCKKSVPVENWGEWGTRCYGKHT